MMYAITCTGLFFMGFLIGTLRRDSVMHNLCVSQQKRGDYWFDKYMMEVRQDWMPMSDDF